MLVALLVLDRRLGLPCWSGSCVAAATVVFRAASSRAYTEAREQVTTVNADLQENVAGLRVAQAFRREARTWPVSAA